MGYTPFRRCSHVFPPKFIPNFLPWPFANRGAVLRVPNEDAIDRLDRGVGVGGLPRQSGEARCPGLAPPGEVPGNRMSKNVEIQGKATGKPTCWRGPLKQDTHVNQATLLQARGNLGEPLRWKFKLPDLMWELVLDSQRKQHAIAYQRQFNMANHLSPSSVHFLSKQKALLSESALALKIERVQTLAPCNCCVLV